MIPQLARLGLPDSWENYICKLRDLTPQEQEISCSNKTAHLVVVSLQLELSEQTNTAGRIVVCCLSQSS